MATHRRIHQILESLAGIHQLVVPLDPLAALQSGSKFHNRHQIQVSKRV
jgi:hypothetical protein